MHWKRLPEREVFFLTNNTIIPEKVVHLHTFYIALRSKYLILHYSKNIQI